MHKITKHRQKRFFIEAQDRKVEHLFKECDKLSKEIWNIPWVELDEPIRAGWKKKYKLRDDISRRADAEDIQKALDLVNTTVYCNREDFIHKTWKNSKKWEPVQHDIHSISHYKWNQIEDKLPPQVKRFFSSYRDSWYSCISHKYSCVRCECRYLNIPKFWLVDDIEPHYHTHYKPVDCDLESQLQRIENHIETHFLRMRHWRKKNGSYWNGHKNDDWGYGMEYIERHETTSKQQLREWEQDCTDI